MAARACNASKPCPSDQLHPPTTTQELQSVPDCANIAHWLPANGFQTSPTTRLIGNLGISSSGASWGPGLHNLARFEFCENEEWTIQRLIGQNTMLCYQNTLHSFLNGHWKESVEMTEPAASLFVPEPNQPQPTKAMSTSQSEVMTSATLVEGTETRRLDQLLSCAEVTWTVIQMVFDNT